MGTRRIFGVCVLAVFGLLALSLEAGNAPVNPFAKSDANAQPLGAQWGSVILSNGESLEGWLHLTGSRRLRMFDRERKEAVHYRLGQLAELRVHVVRNRTEKVWRFKESASDTKVYTGDTYCRKDFTATVVAKMGGRERDLEVALGQVVHVLPKEGERRRFVLQPFMKGEINQPLEEMVHIAWIVFHEEEAAPAAEKRAAYVAEMLKLGAERTAEAQREQARALAEQVAKVAEEAAASRSEDEEGRSGDAKEREALEP